MACVDWATFERAAPELAAAGRERLHGRVAYFGTIRRDGSPRVHPVTPIVSGDALYIFMEPTSPKGKDLERDARFTIHAGVEDIEGGRGEFALAGEASMVSGEARQRAVAAASYVPAERYILFQLSVGEVMHTAYGPAGPVRQRWASG